MIGKDELTFDVLIEIPKGSRNKYEYDFDLKKIRFDRMLFSSMMYPGDYGFIPETLALDGDPLDVIVLGPAVKRGSVLKTKIIGILKLLDRGEQDDKLIAVMEGSVFFEVNSLTELDSTFKGSTTILETFFANYKGPGKMEPLGWGNENKAKKILDFRIEEFKKKENKNN